MKVFYTWGEGVMQNKYDPGFGKAIEWDIPLLDGYDFTFVKNIADSPGSYHFKGIDNPTLIKEIAQWNPDAILVFGWSFKSHLKVLRHFKGKRTVLFRGDSNLLDEANGFSVRKIFRRIFLKWIYRHIDTALYAGSANKAYYLQLGLINDQLVFAPHAIDNDRFMQDDTSNERSSLGIPAEAVVFLFTGKFEEKKHPQLLLDCFIALNNSNAHLLMVGNGKLETQLKTRAGQQATALKNSIHFMPFQNQLKMPAIYKMADALVLPSRGPGETWGLSVNEAMACSRAVLVSDQCGCAADLVKNGQNGFIFKSKDGDDLLKKMQLFLVDQSIIPAMGKRSLEIIQSWNFENICKAVEDAVR